MSSSVSSEHAFSQGGIMISKRYNCLKGNIVEALQCIKCAIWHDLLFQEPAPSSILESKENSDKQENVSTGRDLVGSDDESDIEEFSWDGLLIEDEDEESIYCSE